LGSASYIPSVTGEVAPKIGGCGMQSTAEFRFDCQQMFDLVADVERYPDFVPGWRRVDVRRGTGKTMEVHQVVQVAGFNFAFDSSTTLDPPRRITIAADKGMFDLFEIDWQFQGCAGGCSVTLHIRVAMRNKILEAVLAPLLAQQQREIMRSFELEAERRYRCS
jgi:coenzyme Q-binding protein COQ10